MSLMWVINMILIVMGIKPITKIQSLDFFFLNCLSIISASKSKVLICSSFISLSELKYMQYTCFLPSANKAPSSLPNRLPWQKSKGDSFFNIIFFLGSPWNWRRPDETKHPVVPVVGNSVIIFFNGKRKAFQNNNTQALYDCLLIFWQAYNYFVNRFQLSLTVMAVIYLIFRTVLNYDIKDC